MNNLVEVNKANKNTDLNIMFKGLIESMDKNTTAVAQTLEVHSAQLMANTRLIKTIINQVEDVKTQTETNTSEIIAIKENERITSGQRNKILKEAYKRICDFLEPGTVSWAKYYKMYFQDLYRYLRQNNYLQRPNSETRKKDFDNVMEGFTDWYPDEKTLRKNADTYAEARIEAKKQGYIK